MSYHFQGYRFGESIIQRKAEDGLSHPNHLSGTKEIRKEL
jgi:hypothetical protein